MELHLKMSYKMKTTLPLFQTRMNRNTISCRATNVEMPKGNKTNFYEVLSLASENVSINEIKKAYRTMALRFHPDMCPPSAKEESTRRFIELTEAYETLSDPIMRENYDYELGLVDSIGLGGVCYGKKSSVFPKNVWERQLRGLRKRSSERGERMKTRRK